MQLLLCCSKILFFPKKLNQLNSIACRKIKATGPTEFDFYLPIISNSLGWFWLHVNVTPTHSLCPIIPQQSVLLQPPREIISRILFIVRLESGSNSGYGSKFASSTTLDCELNWFFISIKNKIDFSKEKIMRKKT